VIVRGEIRLVALDHGAGETRPAVIVSNDGANVMATRGQFGEVTVVPVTPDVEVVWRFQVLLPKEESGLTHDVKVQTEQVRSIPITQIKDWVGSVPARRMVDIDEALRFHLAL